MSSFHKLNAVYVRWGVPCCAADEHGLVPEMLCRISVTKRLRSTAEQVLDVRYKSGPVLNLIILYVKREGA